MNRINLVFLVGFQGEVSHANEQEFVQQGKSHVSLVFAHVYSCYHEKHGHVEMATYLHCFTVVALSFVASAVL